MSDVTHTPGPWDIGGRSHGEIIIVASYYSIGCAWDNNGKPENEANARLMAAAPDLLAALTEIRRLAADIPAVERNPRFAEANRTALAAIAKAEGRS